MVTILESVKGVFTLYYFKEAVLHILYAASIISFTEVSFITT